jgi:hypothetical protein
MAPSHTKKGAKADYSRDEDCNKRQNSLAEDKENIKKKQQDKNERSSAGQLIHFEVKSHFLDCSNVIRALVAKSIRIAKFI